MKQIATHLLKGKKSATALRYAQGARYLAAGCAVLLCTFAGYHLRPLFSDADIIILFLVGAVAVAVALGRGPALLYATLSVSAFNYFFVEPVFTFNVSNPSYWLTFAVMFFACLVISALAAQLRDQASLSRRREHEALMLYELMKELAASGTREGMSRSFIRWVAEAMEVEAGIRYPDGVLFGKTVEAGYESKPGTAYRDLPVKGSSGVLGIVSVNTGDAEGLMPDQTVMMETFVGLLGSALERAATAEAAEQSKILAEKEKMRNILLRSVSHDLRSPLAAITGAADTLLQAGSPRDGLLKSIRLEAGRLAKIVNNLLDITRIEGGSLKLNLKAYDPAEIIGSAVETCRDALKNHKLSLDVAPALPFVRMDGLLISQMLQNLLENAGRHTPPGTHVTLKAAMEQGGLRIAVEDEGPGISAGREKSIFNKFSTDSQGDRPKGTGLGLAICQAIMLAHQGSILAENRPGGGCRIVALLPPSATLPPGGDTSAAE